MTTWTSASTTSIARTPLIYATAFLGGKRRTLGYLKNLPNRTSRGLAERGGERGAFRPTPEKSDGGPPHEPFGGGPENKELSRSQQRDNGKAPERKANKKQASRRDKDTESKRHEPLKEGQGESESHVSVFSRMRVPATERLHGRQNAFIQGGAGKIRMPCEEQCDRHREVHPEGPNS
ncbi:unnamed protein product [Cuscuta campestris]|uniref:Uncharacterized protein n=1 Tax=Cuscuta campestris TaxID=132261 RepID=A0A484LQJ3_9ASTE|nr:unnamed protein product [Cuscuta campestris]